MGQKPQISIDTDILIKVFRGDKRKKNFLDDNSGKIAVSIITCFERPSGLKIKQRIINLNQKIKAYDVIHLYEAISRKAFKIFQNTLQSITWRPPMPWRYQLQLQLGYNL